MLKTLIIDYDFLDNIILIGASVIVTCLDWVGSEATGRITCLMDNEKIPIHGKIIFDCSKTF